MAKSNVWKIFIAVLLMLPAAAMAAEDKLPKVPANVDSQLTQDDVDRLGRGEVLIKMNYRAPGVPDEFGSRIAAIAYLNASLDRIWQTVSNWRSYEKIIPNVKEVKLIEKKDNRLLLYFNLFLSFQHVRYYLNYYFYKDKNLVTFQLDRNKKNDFKHFHGYFKFDQVDPKNPKLIQVVYSVDLELGAYFPEFIKTYFTRKDMPKVMSNMKKWVESKLSAGGKS